MIAELETASQNSFSEASEFQAYLLELLKMYGAVVLEHKLSIWNRRNLASGRLDPILIQWFGWIADVGAYWLLNDERIEQNLLELP